MWLLAYMYVYAVNVVQVTALPSYEAHVSGEVGKGQDNVVEQDHRERHHQYDASVGRGTVAQ